MGLSLRGFLVAGVISTSSAAAFGADTKTAFPPCTTTATEADRKAAQGAFAAGQGSFNESDYSTAITYWRDAYRRDCSAHALLLNLARAYELKGDRAEAVNALETYLQRKPDAPDADQVRRRIENLKSQMTATEKPVAPTVLPAAAAAVPPPPAATTAAPATPPPAPEAADTGRSRSAVPLIVAGGGGVLAIVGALVLAGGASKVKEAEDKCPSRESCPPEVAEEGNAGRRQQTTGGVLLGVGVAAAGGGLLWYFLSAPSSDPPPRTAFHLRRPTASPAVGPGYAGISLGASF